MRRLRHDLRLALLGLLALAVHFVVLIGHHHDHLGPLRQPAGMLLSVTAAAQLFDSAEHELLQASYRDGEHDESDCGICQTLAAGATLTLQAPPALSTGFAYASLTLLPGIVSEGRIHRVFAFDARGPPGALTA